MKIEQRIQRAKEKEFNLMRSEIKKVIKAANRRNDRSTCQIESWYYEGIDPNGWAHVDCIIIDMDENGLTFERRDDVTIHCCMFNRQQSFIQPTIDEIEKGWK